jgi:predicted MFS family arabinose efflux permease
MRRVFPVTVGSFALGLDAFVVAGILPVIGGDLDVSVPVAGQLVTVFTLSYALLAPLGATLLAGRPLRMVLVLALLVFTLGNVIGALATSLPILMVSRVVAGLGAGIYAPMSAATAAALVRPEQKGRGLAMIMTGMSAGTVLGVPLGVVLARSAGWRSTLWLVVGVGVIAMACVGLALPKLTQAQPPSLRARASVLGDHRVLSIAAITVFCSGTSLGLFTYIAPLFGDLLNASDVTAFLVLWGLGGLLGSLFVGRLIDKWHDTRALLSVIFAVLGVSLVLLPLLGRSMAGSVALLLLWGATGWSCLTPQQHRLMALRPQEAAVAVSLNASALYLGSASGAALGGVLLAGGLQVTGLASVFGVAALAAGLLNLMTPAVRGRLAKPTTSTRTVPATPLIRPRD